MLLDKLNLDWLYNLKYIEITGEYLLESQREYIRNKYNVIIVNHYGVIETNYIALECPFQNKHLVDDNVFVELDNCTTVTLNTPDGAVQPNATRVFNFKRLGRSTGVLYSVK